MVKQTCPSKCGEVPDEPSLARALELELADQFPPGSRIIPWRPGADFFAFRVVPPGAATERVLRVPLREVTTSVYDGTVASGDVVEREAVVQLETYTDGEPPDDRLIAGPEAGTRTVRVEVFTADPDGFIERAVAAGADGSIDEIHDHRAPWGIRRQGGFIDPFGHPWLVGDKRQPMSGSLLDASGAFAPRMAAGPTTIRFSTAGCAAR